MTRRQSRILEFAAEQAADAEELVNEDSQPDSEASDENNSPGAEGE